VCVSVAHDHRPAHTHIYIHIHTYTHTHTPCGLAEAGGEQVAVETQRCRRRAWKFVSAGRVRCVCGCVWMCACVSVCCCARILQQCPFASVSTHRHRCHRQACPRNGCPPGCSVKSRAAGANLSQAAQRVVNICVAMLYNVMEHHYKQGGA
jgi:hypothetical protein